MTGWCAVSRYTDLPCLFGCKQCILKFDFVIPVAEQESGPQPQGWPQRGLEALNPNPENPYALDPKLLNPCALNHRSRATRFCLRTWGAVNQGFCPHSVYGYRFRVLRWGFA